MRDRPELLESTVDAEGSARLWGAVIDRAVSDAKRGDPQARRWLTAGEGKELIEMVAGRRGHEAIERLLDGTTNQLPRRGRTRPAITTTAGDTRTTGG